MTWTSGRSLVARTGKAKPSGETDQNGRTERADANRPRDGRRVGVR